MFDTIQTFRFLDTVAVPLDTVVYATTTSFEGTPITSNLNAGNWVFIVLFLLFIILILGLNWSSYWIEDVFKNLTNTKTRSSLFSKTSADKYQSKFLITFFSSGVISLYVYLSINTAAQTKLSTYLLLLLSSMSFLFIKAQLMNFIAYVFFDKERLTVTKTNYFNALSLVGIFISPLLILKLYFYVDIDPMVFDFIAIIISLLGLSFISIITIRLFLHNILDFFHIMLYLCTLEILPLIGMFQLYLLILKEF